MTAAMTSSLSAKARKIGRMLDVLTERGLLENTLIIFTADHGETFNYPRHRGGQQSRSARWARSMPRPWPRKATFPPTFERASVRRSATKLAAELRSSVAGFKV